MGFNLFFLGLPLFIQTVVADVDAKIYGDHGDVEKIEEQHVPFFREAGHIGLVDKFGGNSRNVAKDDQAQKGKAFALGGACFP